MILRQYLHTDPVVAASYLFGCGGQATGAVVDPVGEPQRYLEAAAAVRLRLRYIIDTHVHADHRSAGRELAAAVENRSLAAIHWGFSSHWESARLPV
jgi:hydroxyacylglutathione hydrolase